MNEAEVLAAEARQRVGKGSARAARRADMVPAVIYGDKQAPIAIQIAKRVLERELAKGGFFSRMFEIRVGGATERVLPRDVQYHVVKDTPLHVDFLRVSIDTTVTVAVPVHFLNEEGSPGLRRGGVLNVVRHEVELISRADHIPAYIEVDLADGEIGDSFHISAVKLPEGATPAIADRDFTIATIAAPLTGERAAPGEAEGEGEADEDGESED